VPLKVLAFLFSQRHQRTAERYQSFMFFQKAQTSKFKKEKSIKFIRDDPVLIEYYFVAQIFSVLVFNRHSGGSFQWSACTRNT